MGIKRLTRVNELLRREVADVLYRVMNESGADLALVTVTRVETSSDLRHARVMVSVRGDKEVQRDMISRLYGERKEIQRLVGKDVTLKYTPRLSFHLDDSLAEGHEVLRILEDLEKGHPEWQQENGTTEIDTP
jgi:ribosome-binding factor A